MPLVVKGPYRCELCGDTVELVNGCRCGHHAGCDWLEPDGEGGYRVKQDDDGMTAWRVLIDGLVAYTDAMGYAEWKASMEALETSRSDIVGDG